MSVDRSFLPCLANSGLGLLRARRSELRPLIDELNAIAISPDDIRWSVLAPLPVPSSSPATAYGHEVIAAGLLLMSGPIDRGLLLRWLRTSYERRQSNWLPYASKD